MQKGGNGVEGQQCFCSPMPRSGSHESVKSVANENVEVDRFTSLLLVLAGWGRMGMTSEGYFFLSPKPTSPNAAANCLNNTLIT